MHLFIDDVRIPSDVRYDNSKWTVVRNYEDAIQAIEKHKPQIISFDHDLAQKHYEGDNSDEKTGYHIAKKMVEMDMDGGNVFTRDFRYFVHSMNPVGKKNIETLLRRYISKKFD